MILVSGYSISTAVNWPLNPDGICLRLQASKCDISHLLTWMRWTFCHNWNILGCIDNQVLLPMVLHCTCERSAVCLLSFSLVCKKWILLTSDLSNLTLQFCQGTCFPFQISWRIWYWTVFSVSKPCLIYHKL